MADAAALQNQFRRYADLIDSMLPAPIAFAPAWEDATTVQVDRGLVFPALRAGGWSPQAAEPVDRLLALSASGMLPGFIVVDGVGHQRPVYRSLLVYAWLQAYRLVYESMPRDVFGRWEEGLRPWCDQLEAEMGEIEWEQTTPAGRGAAVAAGAWNALALFLAGQLFVRDAWTDLAAVVMGKLARGQQKSGAFLSASPRDNIEAHAYHELVILHAVASYAVQAEDRTMAAAVARAGEFHLNETQPDHATAQPWGVFAFLWNDRTHSLADQQLHAARTHNPSALAGVPLMLLADASYCLRLFL